MENNQMLPPSKLLLACIDVQEKRAKMSVGKMLLLAILAGMFIAGGAAASSVAMHAVSNVGLARMAGACVFPVGLMMIVIVGGELFTGDCLMLLGCMDKRFQLWPLLRVLVLVWIGNLIGAVMIALLVFFSGQFGFSGGLLGAYTIKVALAKTQLSFGAAFSSGILCNIFVCCGVLMGMAAKEASGKIWGIFFPIFAFVLSGYEHCVANMYYIPAGILALTNPTYMQKAIEEYGYSSAQLAELNLKTFFINSSIPVTLGNMVGGMLFVAVILYLAFGKKWNES